MQVDKGGKGQFQLQPTPAGSAFPQGTLVSWSDDNTGEVVLTPDQADQTQVEVDVAATATATSFNLTATTNYTPEGAAGPIVVTVNVTINTPAPPPATGGQIVQLS